MRIIVIFLSLFAVTQPSLAQITWTQIESGTDRYLNTIQFVDNLVGYIGGDRTLLKTTDGGANWLSVQLDSLGISPFQSLNIADMHWFSEDHGIILASGWDGMRETYDGGFSWEVVATGAGFCDIGSLFYFDENLGFAGGAGCFEGHIIDRFDNGSWTTAMDPNDWSGQNLVISIEFKDAMTGFAGTNNGTILRTTDAGLNWDTISNNLQNDALVTDFAFYGGDTIRASITSEWGVMISFDNGLTWGYDSETATFFYPQMEAIHIDGNGTSFIGGSSSNITGVIFDNHGPFWYYNTIGHPIRDITSHSDSITFLVGDTGAIYVNVDPSTLTTTELIESPAFNMAPNPALDELNISGVEGMINKITVFDSSGRLVIQEMGVSSTQRLDVSRLESGVFILVIETEKGVARKEFVKH
ncbi:MAG: hypothetical protein ACI9FU_000750 [Granulosicoccus sp.]|jgi:hypothetical protein